MRILADQPAGALFQRVLGAALADAGDAGVGLDGHHMVALIEERVGIGRLVDAHARDLHLRNSGPNEGRRCAGGDGCARQRLSKSSSIHLSV